MGDYVTASKFVFPRRICSTEIITHKHTHTHTYIYIYICLYHILWNLMGHINNDGRTAKIVFHRNKVHNIYTGFI